jgi:hypothetical protein
MTATKPPPVAPGDFVTYTIWTDRVVYEVLEVKANGKTLELREAAARLLNGPNSGEPDALHFSPGGFFGHTSGAQRWEVKPDRDGQRLRVTWRPAIGAWKPVGIRTSSPGCRIRPGAHPHHDFNF